MSVQARLVNPVGTRVFMGVLTEGIDLLAGLKQIALDHEIQAGRIELLGGLQSIEFAAYDFVRHFRYEPLRLEGAIEITGGHGTISIDQGEPHVHLHLVVSVRGTKKKGGRMAVYGGHVTSARVFAVETIIMAYDGAPVQRALDEATGLRLWDISP